jgi:hypothetical protein
MGLVLNLMHNPGTEVPGYFPSVPMGRKMAKLRTPSRQSATWGYCLAGPPTRGD